MQCPALEEYRVNMYNKLYKIDPEVKEVILTNPNKVFLWILGGNVDGLDVEVIIRFWITAGYEISRIYKKSNPRQGWHRVNKPILTSVPFPLPD